jgi:hypothetical protein
MLSLPATGITRMLVTRGEELLWLDTTEVLQIYPRKNEESGGRGIQPEEWTVIARAKEGV